MPPASIGTDHTPLVVRTLEEPENAIERAEAAKHRAWERNNASAALYVGFAMAAFALLQLLLFLWQLRLMRETVKDASHSANAASAAAQASSLSARAAIRIELPLINASLLGLFRATGPTDPYDPRGGFINAGYPDQYASAGPFVFKNSGRSSAFLDLLQLGWMVVPDLPPQPLYQEMVPFEHLSSIGPGEEFQAPYHLALELTPEQQKDLRDRRALLWIFGALRYRDFMGDTHEDRFCFHYEERRRGILNPFAFYKDGRPPSAYTEHKVHHADNW
jgi:hypothetical protein